MERRLDEAKAAGSERTAQTSAELGRPDTLSQSNPYGLQLSDVELRDLVAVLGEQSLHYAVGFLTGAATIPEPLSWESCLETLSTPETDADFDEDEDEDEEEAEEEDEEEIDDSGEPENVLGPPEQNEAL